MITIKHVKAHLPSKNCQLTFMLRKKNPGNSVKQSEIKLTQQYIDLDVNCVIQIGQFKNFKQDVQLCVIAVTQNHKVFVGATDIDIKQNIQDQRATLRGVADQDGYLVYSVQKEQNSYRSLKGAQPQAKNNNNKVSSQRKSSGTRGFIKYKDSSSSGSFNDNHHSFESKSGSQSPFKKNKYIHNMDSNSEEYYRLLDQLYHDILEQQLFNQRAWNRIQQNQIFQLRYKQRIQALLGKNNE